MMARGACPSLAAPMETGDGLLVRLGGGAQWTPAAMLRLAEAAARHGSGAVEVTARGSLQVRGLRAATAAAFARAVGDLGGEGVVLVGALAGEDPAMVDPAPVAAAVAGLIGDVAPKFSVIVDGGGALHLDAVPADLRLAAEGGGWRVAVGRAVLGRVDDPVEAARRALAVLGGRRAREVLAEAGAGPFLAAFGHRLRPAGPAMARPDAEPVGIHALGARFAVGVAPAFGAMEAAALAALAGAAMAEGAGGLRPAPGRALVATGLRHPGGLPAVAAALGFVTDPADPRRRVAACAGAPGCASAFAATRPLAAALAAGMALPAGGLHVSGCAKGCAHPGPAGITLVGGAAGIALVRDGTARGLPSAWFPDAAAALRALVPGHGAGDTGANGRGGRA